MATSTQLRQRIAAGEWDPKLRALYGNTEQELCRQRARYCAALEQFELYFGPGRQVQVYSAPGRAELGGNHTDHQHGYGLAAAVTLDLVAVAARNTDGYVRVKSRGFNKLDVIDLTVAGPQEGEGTHSARLIRGTVLQLKEQEYIQACRIDGGSSLRIILKHLFPNCIPMLIVSCTLGIPSAILTEASLSYLGLGVPSPTASWGSMISGAQTFIRTNTYYSLFPGLCIILTVIAFNTLGDGLRDVLDPKLRK